MRLYRVNNRDVAHGIPVLGTWHGTRASADVISYLFFFAGFFSDAGRGDGFRSG
jgi:hypothetical protein